MSISSISQSNVLVEDVLQMIFQHLDAGDLLKCEAVCRQWRDIFLAGTPWRRLYHRNIGRLRLWRKAQKELELDQKTLRTEQYRGICKDILQKVDRNWRRGHFTKLTCPVSSSCATCISINDDYVAWNISYVPHVNGLYGRICAFLDTESMEINEITTYFSVGKQNTSSGGCSSEMLVSRYDLCSGNLEIVSRKNRWAVNIWDGLDEGEKKNLTFKLGSKLLVTYCHCEDRERIRIWKMGNLPVLLHDRTCKFRNLYLAKVDKRFIVLCNFDATFYFISTETFEEFRTVSWKENYYGWGYDRGLLFQFIYGYNENE